MHNCIVMFMCKVRSLYVTVPLATSTSSLGPSQRVNKNIASGTTVERVTTFKLLGVYVATNLKWAQQVDAISSKAALRLHFLMQLKRSGAGRDDLL